MMPRRSLLAVAGLAIPLGLATAASPSEPAAPRTDLSRQGPRPTHQATPVGQVAPFRGGAPAGPTPLSVPVQAAAGGVTVVTEGVAPGEGTIRIAICRRERFLAEDAGCPWGATVPANGATVRVELRDIPPGTYAVLAHQDSNADGLINRWPIVAIPREPLGFLAGRWHPRIRRAPTFDEAAVDWPSAGATLRVELYPTAAWF